MTPLHLPKTLQLILVDNLWRLAILRIAVGTIMLGTVGNATSTNTKSAQILLIMIGIIAVLTILSIVPLMKRQKLGWLLFFLTMPVQALGIVVSLIVSSNIILIGAIVGAIVAGYVLLDIRNYYT